MRSAIRNRKGRSYIVQELARILCLTVLALAGGALAVHAQSAKLELGPLQKLAARAKEVTEVTLDHQMLQLAQKFMSNDESSGDAEARQLVGQLKGIYIKHFVFDQVGEYSQADVDNILDQLHGASWQRIVSYRKEKEHESDDIYMMGSGNAIKGLAIISAQPKTLTVVNIIGSIDLQKLSALEGHFGIPRVRINRQDKQK